MTEKPTKGTVGRKEVYDMCILLDDFCYLTDMRRRALEAMDTSLLSRVDEAFTITAVEANKLLDRVCV